MATWIILAHLAISEAGVLSKVLDMELDISTRFVTNVREEIFSVWLCSELEPERLRDGFADFVSPDDLEDFWSFSLEGFTSSKGFEDFSLILSEQISSIKEFGIF